MITIHRPKRIRYKRQLLGAANRWKGVKAVLPDAVVVVRYSESYYITFGADCTAVWGEGVYYSAVVLGIAQESESTLIPVGRIGGVCERLHGRSFVVLES